MLSQEERQLADRYFGKSLTGMELHDFMTRIEADVSFKKEVSFHNKLIEGIADAEDRRLMQYIIDASGYRKKMIPLSLKLILTFLLITGGGIILWEYIGPGSTGVKYNYFKWAFNGKGKVPPEPIAQPETGLVKSPQIKTEELPVEKVTAELQPPADTISSQEIVVRKDQLLITYNLQPIELATDFPSPQQTGDVSDPEAGLPETKLKSYEIEFWVSPVNYKGYKLQGEKLILFGIEVPDEIQLYSIKDKLWLKYGNDFYKIETNNDFESLVEVSTVPTELK